MESIIRCAGAYACLYFIPGYLLCVAAGWHRFRFLLALALSMCLSVLNLELLHAAGFGLKAGPWAVEILILLLVCLGRGRSRWAEEKRRCLHRWRQVARFKTPLVWIQGPAGALLVWLALMAGLATYAVQVGPYTEVPADVWQHLARIQDALRDRDASQGGAYALQALLCRMSRVSLQECLPILAVAQSLLWGCTVYFVALFVFARLKVCRLIRSAIAASAVLFGLAHMGVGCFSFVRCNLFAPEFPAFLLFLVIGVLGAELLWQGPRRGAAGWVLPFSGLALLVMHRPTFVYAVFLVGALALATLLAAGLPVIRACFAKKGPDSRRWPALDAESRARLWRGGIVCAVGLALGIGVGFMVWRPLAESLSASPGLYALAPGVPWLSSVVVVNPRGLLGDTITTWGGFVYLLFILHFFLFKRNVFLLGGMLLPLLTAFNPLVVRLAAGHGPSAVAALARIGLALPLCFVAGYMFFYAASRILADLRLHPSKVDYPRRLWMNAVWAGLFVLLLPVHIVGGLDVTSRIRTLYRTPAENDFRQWADLWGYLAQMPPHRVLTDPVTGIMINGLTPHQVATVKYQASLEQLRVRRGPNRLRDVFRDILPHLDAPWLLVLNEREGGLSALGYETGRWPETVLRVSRHYPALVKTFVQDHPELFKKQWEHDRVIVYAIDGLKLKDRLQAEAQEAGL